MEEERRLRIIPMPRFTPVTPVEALAGRKGSKWTDEQVLDPNATQLYERYHKGPRPAAKGPRTTGPKPELANWEMELLPPVDKPAEGLETLEKEQLHMLLTNPEYRNAIMNRLVIGDIKDENNPAFNSNPEYKGFGVFAAVDIMPGMILPE